MIAQMFPPRSGAKVKRPKTADEWAAHEGKPVFCKEKNGRPHTAMLVEVMGDKARVIPSTHGHPEVVALKDLRPWVKGESELETIRQIHAQRAGISEAKLKARELMVMFNKNTGRFLGGIDKTAIDGVTDGYEVGTKAGMTYPLDQASRIPRCVMAELFHAARKARLADASCSYMTLEKAAKRWAEVQEAEASAERKAKADALEAKRAAREARAKAAAESRRVLAAGPEPEVLPPPAPEPVAAIPGPPEPKPTPAPVQAPETAPARREPAAVVVPEPAPVAKALAARVDALRALAYAENLVLEARGRLVMANAEVEIARGR